MSKGPITHGLSNTPEYSAWKSMIARCTNPKHPKYVNYGGRGIVVCQRWKDSIHNFINDVGTRPFPSASIGRIDNDGNYEPSNVRWETPLQQMRNTTWNRKVTIGGVTKPLSAWSEESGVAWKTLWGRIEDGWPEDKLLIPTGSAMGRKLTASDVVQIRQLKAEKMRMKKIAERFGVTVSMINKIVNGESWSAVA